jgi:hypothetical protein
MRYIQTVYYGNSANLEYSTDCKNWELLLSETDTYFLNPVFSPSTQKIAYIKSGELIVSQATQKAKLIYGLWVYDFQTKTEKELFYPIFKEERDKQQNFVWLSDDEILFIDGSQENALPLKVVKTSDASLYSVESSTKYHFDLDYHLKTGRLAFTSKGNNESDDLSFTKLFTGRLVKK